MLGALVPREVNVGVPRMVPGVSLSVAVSSRGLSWLAPCDGICC